MTKTITAWLFDIIPQPYNILTYWVTQDQQTLKCFLRQTTCLLYALPTTDTSLESFFDGLLSHPDILAVNIVQKRVSIHDTHYSDVIEFQIPLSVDKPKFFQEIRDVFPLELFDVDLSDFQFLYQQTGLFPFCKTELTLDPRHNILSFKILDKLTAFNYELPPVKAVHMELFFTNPLSKDKLSHITLTTLNSTLADKTEEVWTLDKTKERELILDIVDWVFDHDPDILVTQGGDHDLRLFASRAVAHELGFLSLTREKSLDPLSRIARQQPKGTSFMSYGGHYYKDQGYYLKGGRHHVDLRNSFTWEDGGFAGIVELARLSCIDPQRCARTSIGTNLTGMQIRQALLWDILIPSRKADAERFRSGESLVVGDRGGFIFSPRVGLHFNVASIDFSSMFPELMVKKNISPETVNCDCCADGSGRPIPGTQGHTCIKRKGLVPLVLKTVLTKRLFYKKFKHVNKSYDQLQKTLKWILVTCFDPATPLPFVKEGNIHILPIGQFVEQVIQWNTALDQYEILGLDSQRRPILNSIKQVIKLPSPPTMFKITLERQREMLVTGDHICYILKDTMLVEREAKDLSMGDSLPVLQRPIQQLATMQDFLTNELTYASIISITEVPAKSDYVYCLEVTDQLPGFFTGTDGIFTHNCFGYQGYRNARFGRIEAHETINAYARDTLLQAGEIFQNYQFELVAGIVDSLWGKYEDEHAIDGALIDQICKEIEQVTELPIANDGTFRWIVFLPRRHEPEVGVLNRYYGCFEDGSFKFRGIELRRRDTCAFIKKAQQEALETLAPATSKEEFYQLIQTKFWEVHEKYDSMLVKRTITIEELFITKILAKGPADYKQSVHQAIAAQQLTKAGVHLQSGMKISFLVTNSTSKTTLKRVIAKDLYTGQLYDIAWYRRMLKEAFTNIIPPKLTTEKQVTGSLQDFITDNVLVRNYQEEADYE